MDINICLNNEIHCFFNVDVLVSDFTTVDLVIFSWKCTVCSLGTALLHYIRMLLPHLIASQLLGPRFDPQLSYMAVWRFACSLSLLEWTSYLPKTCQYA